MKTLADFPSHTRTWGPYTLKVTTAVIGWDKTHMGEIETITAETEPHKPGTYRVGDVFSSKPFCNGNGQHKGRGPRAGYDTDKVTCIKCRRYIGAEGETK